MEFANVEKKTGQLKAGPVGPVWVLDSDFKMMERLGHINHTDNDDMQ